MTISKAVTRYAQENGYKFYVQSLGYRKLVEILDADNKHIGWTSNKSDCARNSINALIQQKQLTAKSNEAIATESEQAYEDLTPATPAICDVEAEQAYQELQPVIDQWELDRQERIASQGAYTADDFRSTYERRDNFGDDAFALSARYGCGALI